MTIGGDCLKCKLLWVDFSTHILTSELYNNLRKEMKVSNDYY